ncbi:hypothetical protein [Herbiconiux ginsengi]|uniref:PQQ-like domain-containing protein n=1 Tax=Herbiconiux ginsengi TaxID=381665 RepID=A0A1H3QRJ2_9MICO|nr:hypothetical protein [Herbiconiux ginsengi]SDZ15638.1 hypothetical protein SAMN05216554_2680 [Herbiconiux ginsengi]
MNEPRFDPERSAAIRTMLTQTVEAEPARARRVHFRITLAAVLAALGVTFGGTAVAVALSGGSLFTVGAPAPVTTSSSPAPSPSATEAATPAPTPTAPSHSLAITGDRIMPHDIVSAPGASPLWSIDLPALGGAPGCTYDTVIDVSDGYAVVQQSLIAASASPDHCDVSSNRLAVTLVDTAAGSIVWSRDWSWEPSDGDSTTARLLGTSGRVLIWDRMAGVGPAEVLELATGETLGPVTVPDGYSIRELNAVPGESGDVIYTAPRLDADGQPTTEWSVRRADPMSLGTPLWSHEITADQVLGYNPIGNSSSVLNVPYLRDGSGWADDVLDADTGAVMAAGVPERSYIYFDGFTLRETGFTPYGVPSAIAGIDDAGNEFWSRESESGIAIGRVDLPGQKPAAIALNDGSDLALFTAGNQLELIEGLTGQAKWTADATACDVDPASFDRSSAFFTLQPDGVLVDVYKRCAFDYATGDAVDVGARRDPGSLGSAVDYELSGGYGTGGQRVFDGVIPGSGTATAFDAVSGEELWTIPIASDERWESAGGYVVGFSDGRMFGIG